MAKPLPKPLLVRGGRVIDPSQGIDGRFDLLLEDGAVARLDESLEARRGDEVVDAAGLVVCPGLIDIHVHLREPGQEYKETIESGTRAAAAGGFTAVACMPNTVPVNDNRAVTESIVAEAQRWGYARVYPVGAVSAGMGGESLAEIGDMVRAGAVAVSDDGLPVRHPELMRRALLYARHFRLPITQHAEDLELTAQGVMHEGEWSTRLGLAGIPGASEDLVVARDLILAEETGGRYHVAHLSTARSLELVRRARERGVAVTCEVTPHHLVLTEAAVAETGFSTHTKMKPPLRSEADRQALVAGLADGTVDAIATDHAPHHADEKDVPFDLAPFGIVGLETALSLCLDRLVHGGVIDLPRLVELLSTGPARCYGLPGGTLAVGSPADVTLFDPERTVTVDAATFRSKSRNTPFHGWQLRGAPVRTILAGRPVEP
ncbi:MAG TPA: dihydroorotase [Thermoanaerobaculia bacterium]|nr:dihydroorotase [Thermoanaerobaculia bacterium]